MRIMARWRLIHIVPLAFLLFLSAAAIYGAVNLLMADLNSMRSRWQINQWQKKVRQPPQLSEVGRARNALTNALAWTPDDPLLYENLAYLYALQAMRVSSIPDLREALLDETIANYRLSLQHRPMAPYAWGNLALALHYRRADDNSLWIAYDRAYRYGRKEGGIQLMLAQIALERWNTLGEERQQHMRQIFAEAHGQTRKVLMKLAEAAERSDLLP